MCGNLLAPFWCRARLHNVQLSFACFALSRAALDVLSEHAVALSAASHQALSGAHMLCKRWSWKACLTLLGSAAEFVSAPAVAPPGLQAAFEAQNMLCDARLRARAAKELEEVQFYSAEAWKVAAEEPGHYVYVRVRSLATLALLVALCASVCVAFRRLCGPRGRQVLHYVSTNY